MQPKITELTVLDRVPFGQTERETPFFALRLSHPDWESWHPGQFFMLRPFSFGLEIPWARPLCICHMTSRHLVCFVKKEGRGTAKIAELAKGDKVLVWGPLGNHFAMEKGSQTVLLAGGMGIAPFVGYVNLHPQPWNLSMLFGHRYPLGCFPVDSINEHIPVDSLREYDNGDLDNFIFSLKERIADCAAQNGLVLACGPLPFLRTVQNFSRETGARTQLSLENRMACGVGVCLGCVCKPANKLSDASRPVQPLQVCTHGPVFWSHEIEL